MQIFIVLNSKIIPNNKIPTCHFCGSFKNSDILEAYKVYVLLYVFTFFFFFLSKNNTLKNNSNSQN